MRLFTILLTSSLFFVACKKKDVITELSKIESIGIKPGEVLLYSSAPALFMAPGEETNLRISQMAAITSDSIPAGLTFSSSDPSVATFSNIGKVNAIRAGNLVLTVTNRNGKKVEVGVSVQTSNLPPLTEAIMARFEKPINFIKQGDSKPLNIISLNRLGQVVNGNNSFALRGKQATHQISAGGSVSGLPEGFYEAVNEQTSILVPGIGIIVIYNPTKSILFTNKQPQIYHIGMLQGKYPLYFSKKGLVSDPLFGDVHRLMTVPGSSGGVEVHQTITSEEVNAVPESGEVISGGTKITALKAGVERWAPSKENFTGSWMASQVFFDFAGDWYCANDGTGKNIKLNVPAVPNVVIHGGHKAKDLFDLPRYYKQNSRRIAFAQLNNATSLFTDNTYGTQTPNVSTEIGPMPGTPQVPQSTKPVISGSGHGYINFTTSNRFGPLTYVNDSVFNMGSDVGASQITFVKVAAPVIGSGSFTLAGNTYSGACYSTPTNWGGTGIDVTIRQNSGQYLTIVLMPTASSGTTSFILADGPRTSLRNTWALSYANRGYETLAGGTLTKTGPRSFTFTCNMWSGADPNSNPPFPASGSGSY